MIISIANQKGGVGKSTTAHAINAGLSAKGFRSLLIDLDPQGNISYSSGLNGSDGIDGSYELISHKAKPSDIIQVTESGHVIGSSMELSKLDFELMSKTGKEYKLLEALSPIKGEYDFILLDTPPALGILTINALTASDYVIIPAQADVYSLQGIGQLVETIDAVRQYCNRELNILGILLTRYDKRSILSRDMLEMIEDTAKEIGTRVFESHIREGVAIKEAQASRRDIFSYAPHSNPGQDYMALVGELIGLVGNVGVDVVPGVSSKGLKSRHKGDVLSVEGGLE